MVEGWWNDVDPIGWGNVLAGKDVFQVRRQDVVGCLVDWW